MGQRQKVGARMEDRDVDAFLVLHKTALKVAELLVENQRAGTAKLNERKHASAYIRYLKRYVRGNESDEVIGEFLAGFFAQSLIVSIGSGKLPEDLMDARRTSEAQAEGQGRRSPSRLGICKGS